MRLLAVEPDVGRFLTAQEWAEAEGLSLPVREVGRGALDVGALLGEANAFAAFILQGMLLERLQVADQPTLRLLGPGDFLSLSANGPSLLAESRCNAAAPTRLAMLGNEANGVYGSVMKHRDGAVYIPMLGKGRSLNVHVAAAIVGFHVRLRG